MSSIVAPVPAYVPVPSALGRIARRVGGWHRALGCLLVLAMAASALVVGLAARPVAATTQADAYKAYVLGRNGNVAHYWRLDDSPAVGGGFADEVPTSSGWPYGATLGRGADTTVAQPGVMGGSSSVKLGSATGSKLGAGLRNTDGGMTNATIEVLVKPTSLPAAGQSADIVSWDSPWWGGAKVGLWLTVNSDGYVTGIAGFGSYGVDGGFRTFSLSRLKVGEWSRIALTYLDTGRLSIMFDGTVENHADVPGTPTLHWGATNYDNPKIQIGVNADNWSNDIFQGSIDDVVLSGGGSPDDAVDAREEAAGQAPLGLPRGGISETDPRSRNARNKALRSLGLARGCACDPVDTGTGNFYESVPGISVPSRAPGMGFGLTYNASPAPLEPTDGPLGFGWSGSPGAHLERDISGKVTVIQEDGSAVPFDPDGATGWAAAPNFDATLAPSGSNVVFTRGSSDRFTFEMPSAPAGNTPTVGRLLARSDLYGNTSTLTYSTSSPSHVESISDGQGHLIDPDWTGNHITSVTDSTAVADGGPRSLALGYDANGDLTTYTDAQGGHWTFTYDANHRLKTLRKPRHDGSPTKVLENVYDAQGRVTSQFDELDRETTMAYDHTQPGWTLTTKPGGVEKRLDKYVDGRREESVSGYGSSNPQVTRWTLDPATWAPVTSTDGAGKVTHYDHDAVGNTTKIQDPTGRITRMTYNARNQVTSTLVGETTTSTAHIVTTTNEYDAATGRLEKTTVAAGTPDAAVTDYVYGDVAHPEDVTSVIDARAKTWYSAYDGPTGLQTSVTDPLGHQTKTTYNSLGWPKTVTTPQGVATASPTNDYQTSYAYNLATRTTTVTDPTGNQTVTVLDANGNTSSVTTGAGTAAASTTSYVYDDTGRLLTEDLPGAGDNTHTYFDSGEEKTYSNPSGTWSYAYDPAGRLQTTTDPKGRVETDGYDSAGRLAWVQQATASASCAASPKVGCVSYSYDDAGRPTGVEYSDPATPSIVKGTDFKAGIEYDSIGRRITTHVGGHDESWVWNDRSQLTSHTM